jgi:radical SAM protein with 4Fe4S-binding SPASM domain
MGPLEAPGVPEGVAGEGHQPGGRIAERVGYQYAAAERRHRFRFLFDPLRLLEQGEFLERYRRGENPFPLSVEIDPSNACNHDCGFCIYHALHQPGRRERLPDRRLFGLVDELRDLGCRSILFVGGGEPMTHPKTVEAMERAASYRISCGLVTNGSLVDDGKAERLKHAATYVRFSLDAATRETHRRLHQRDDFATIVANLRRLARAPGGCTVGTGFFINEANVREIVDGARLARDTGADYIQFKTYSGIAWPAELHVRILLEIEQAMEFSGGGFDVHVADRIFQNHPFQVRGYTRCHFQAMKTVINADGNVYLCAQKRTDPSGVIGNVHRNSLREIWEGAQRRQTIEDLCLADCPYCVHDQQNKMLEFLTHFRAPHRSFY